MAKGEIINFCVKEIKCFIILSMNSDFLRENKKNTYKQTNKHPNQQTNKKQNQTINQTIKQKQTSRKIVLISLKF